MIRFAQVTLLLSVAAAGCASVGCAGAPGDGEGSRGSTSPVVSGEATSADGGAGTADPPPATDGGSCSTLADQGSKVDMVTVPAMPRTFSGGTIADGVYVLTQAHHIVEHEPYGAKQPVGTDTIEVSGGAIQSAGTYSNGAARSFSGALTAQGAALGLATSCDVNGLGLWSDLVPLYPGQGLRGQYTADPTGITIMTRRGNHEQILRVYTRVERR